jgi:Family of unknown function (DUF6256)
VILRGVVAPVAAGFAVCVLMVVYASLRPVPRPHGSRRVRSRSDVEGMLRCLAVTAAGGYAAMLAIVFVFGVVLAGDRGALRSAAWSAPFLLAVATPVFLALSWAFGRRSG